MRVPTSTLPWRLSIGFLAALFFSGQGAQGAQAVNVALKSSFNAAPYLVELLYATRVCTLCESTDSHTERQPRSRMPPPTFLCWTLLRKALSWI